MEGLKFLFIPSDGYFDRVRNELQSKFSEKFGGLQGLLSYLQNRFSRLSRYRDTDSMLVLKYPKDHIWSNARIDLLLNSGDVLAWIRGAASGLVSLMTAVYVFQKVKELVNT